MTEDEARCEIWDILYHDGPQHAASLAARLKLFPSEIHTLCKHPWFDMDKRIGGAIVSIAVKQEKHWAVK
jgi:hypothetical protein